MLELKNITKVYPAGDGKVHALKGINLQFRSSEFVSILGPSGCGKTTMLNIIGGLDQYTSGDLVINGRSTKNYKDRDWDSYRNHSVGFVFQSYNLIPHQTVLQNVELALTLSGVSKHERRKRAKEALEKVGLGDQLRKKPNQMSGGQMQRVAIARAIVNNPDIILADEPTGALDTETSVQVMEILRQIAKDRLVIMVTHNPEIAEEYSTRIVRVVDGLVISDTAPLSLEEYAAESTAAAEKMTRQKKEKKPSMSLATSFGLSLRNLISKKGRTTLTAFAGSIGIIGIALIYAVSQGMTTYINIVQEETLSSYPLTIKAESMDMGTLFMTFMGQAQSKGDHDQNGVYEKTMLYDMINSLNSMETSYNDLKSFKTFIGEQLKDPDSKLSKALNGVQYGYDLDMVVYTKNVDGTIIPADTMELMQELMVEHLDLDMSSMIDMSESYGVDMEAMASMGPMGSVTLFQEMLPGKNGELISPMISDQYDKIYGNWPNSYDEIMLVVDENNEIDDLTLYALGLKSKAEMDMLANAATSENKEQLDKIEMKHWTFEEICALDYRVVFNADCYAKVGEIYTDLRKTPEGLTMLYNNGLNLKVTGILRPKEDATANMLTSTIVYTSKLTEYVIQQNRASEVIQAQLASPHKDIFTGLPFKENTGNLTAEEKQVAFLAHLQTLNEKEKAQTYIAIRIQNLLMEKLTEELAKVTPEIMEQVVLQAIAEQYGKTPEELKGVLKEEDIKTFYTGILAQQLQEKCVEDVMIALAGKSDADLAAQLDMESAYYSKELCELYYDGVLEFSQSSYKDNLQELGYLDLTSPATINLYASSFENKDVIEEVIAEYNEGKDELSKITYTDYIGLLMSSVTTIIDAITYVLIAFVSVSLIVSSIMIGVITLISVQERTKEIGVLRAIGASKRNVSSMFNAETIMIGLASGVIGVGVTWLLCIPINAILFALTGLGNLRAYLPLDFALILVGISVVLTMFAGVIPSRSAAKKDPVVALRTE